MTTPIPFPPIIELDSSASTLLDALVDLGHLDEPTLEKVNHVLSTIDKPLNEHGMATISLDDIDHAADLLAAFASSLDGQDDFTP